MKALIHGERVCQIAEEEYAVAPPLQWVDAPEGVTTQHTYVDGEFVAPPEPEPEAETAALGAYAAQRRWQKEVGGITVGGMPIYTDDRSKMMIMGARIKATADPEFTTQWKAANGAFITVDAPTIIAMSDAVLGHVDACFTIEGQVLAGIAAEEITTTEEIDAAFDSWMEEA